jgi:hypothetical protein
MEVPPKMVAECVVTRVKKLGLRSTRLSAAIHFLIRSKSPYTDAKTLGNLLLTCWEMYECLGSGPQSTFWVRFLGYKLNPKNLPANVSPLRLFVHLRAEATNETWDRGKLVAAGNWTSGGGVANTVSEKVKSKKLTDLLIFVSDADSMAYWTGRIVEMLQIKAFPNEEEVKELTFALEKVIDQAETPEDDSSSVAALEDAICEIVNPNQTLICVVLVKLLRKRAGSDLGPPGLQQTAFAFQRLMPTVTVVQYTAALLCGKEVSELKNANWGKLQGTMPAAFRRAAMHALAAMSTQRKMDIFKKQGLMKNIFTSFHLRSLLKAEIRKASVADQQAAGGVRLDAEGLVALGNASAVDGMKMLYLCQAVLRKEKYPASEAAWTAEVAHEWSELILEPLARLSGDALFEIPPQWIVQTAEQRATFQPDLAAQKLVQPYRNDPTALLAREGNNAESWDRLLELSRQGVLTAPQAMLFIRTLILLAYPCRDDEQVAGSPRPRPSGSPRKTKARTEDKVGVTTVVCGVCWFRCI